MNSVQKVIKYIAMAFAVVLAIGIISSVVGIIGSVFFSFDSFKHYDKEITDISKSFENIKSLEISVSGAELKIRNSDKFLVDAKNVSKQFKCDDKNGTLIIEEKLDSPKFINTRIFGAIKNKSTPQVILYLPADFKAENVIIKTGAGVIDAEKLSANRLDFNFGAGEVTFKNLTADKAKIEGGVGNIELKNCSLANLDFETGVGSADISGRFTGENEIESGVGELNLELENTKDDLNLYIKAGVGEIRVNGEKTGQYKSEGKSGNSLKIDGGVGEINVDLKK